MSGFLGDLMAEGSALLADVVAVDGKETVAVAHDRYDHDDWIDTRQNAPALEAAIDELKETFDYTEDLAEGVFDYFLKADPEILPAEAMKPSHKPNHQITLDAKDTPQAAELRQYTVGDPYSTAMATTGISEKLREFLQENKDLAEKAREAQEAADAQQGAGQGLEDALAGAGGVQGEYSGEGPMTQPQADAAAQLQAAIEAQKAAQAAAAQAAEALNSSIAQAGPGSRTAVKQGVAEATAEAAEQAAAMAGCGVDPGEIKYMSFEQRKALAEAMSEGRLRAVAWLIGRFRMEAKADWSRHVENRREIFTEIEQGRDLSRALGSEIAKFAGPKPLKLDTLRRYAEGKLLLKRFEGSEKQGKGPIVCIVDTSGSMQCDIGGTSIDDETAKMIPTREAWAKAITFVLLDSARRQKRDFYCILFSSRGQQRHYQFTTGRPAQVMQADGTVIELPETNIPGQPDLAVVMDLIAFMFNGGTEFEEPLTQGVNILHDQYNETGKGKADIAFITDDDGHVSEPFMAAYVEAREKIGFRTFGFAVGCQAGYVLNALCNADGSSVRSLADLSSTEEVQDVFRAI
jgi:uncharacterized protein with von Willebrand factor type A (vWA) domain